MSRTSPESTQRIAVIDQFRGFAIILMVIFNYLSGIETIPDWLKHVPDIGMNFPDLGTPVFVFAIGLTYGLSYRRRVQENGLSAAVGHFLRRYLSFIGLGAIITAGQSLLGYKTELLDWGVLQSIGLAGLITLAIISRSTWIRLGVGLGLLAIYQVLLERYWLGLVLGSQHGGLPGSLSWAAILILSTVLADIFHDQNLRKNFPWVSLALLLGGFALTILVPVSKNRLTASYDLITLGFSGLAFSIFYLANFQLDFFSAWGRNPLLLYLLSFLVTGIFVLPDVPWWYVNAPLWLVGLQCLVLVLILSAVANYLEKRAVILSM
jgi:predicted acyltransferase